MLHSARPLAAWPCQNTCFTSRRSPLLPFPRARRPFQSGCFWVSDNRTFPTTNSAPPLSPPRVFREYNPGHVISSSSPTSPAPSRVRHNRPPQPSISAATSPSASASAAAPGPAPETTETPIAPGAEWLAAKEASADQRGPSGSEGEEVSGGEDPEVVLSGGARQGTPIWPRGTLTAVILGGGEADSRRLFPLTQYRTLPAIPFGGSYRIIDLLMSNLINSGVNKIHILTAYNSYSLNRHLQRTYDTSGGVPYGGDGYIEVVANTMSPDTQQWATGTAGVVRNFMSYFESNSKNRFIEDVLILPGDHVYVTDLTPIIAYHHSTGADLTVVCRPVSGELASQLGVVKLDSKLRINAFREKPDAGQLSDLAMSDDEMRCFLTANHHEQHAANPRGRGRGRAEARRSGPAAATTSRASSLPRGAGSETGSESDDGLGRSRSLWAARGHARVGGGAGDRVVLDTLTSADDMELGRSSPGYVGSTGIYIFKRSVLSEALRRHFKAADFGRQIIPEIIQEGRKVYAYRLPGYWADVGGSVGDFYAANLALLGSPPSIDFDTPVERPMFRFPLTIPATQLQGSKITGCLVSSGCIIKDAVVRNSVVGPRNIIGSRVTISDSVLMGASHYEHERPQPRPLSPTFPPMGIGEDTLIRQAVVDLNCRIGRGVQLINKEGVYESYDRAVQGMYVRDGVIVLSREAVVPDGTVM